MRSAPLHDGTADTAEFDCGACGNRHPRFLPDDDGIRGGQGRTASSLRDGYVGFCVAVVAILCILGIALWLGWR